MTKPTVALGTFDIGVALGQMVVASETLRAEELVRNYNLAPAPGLPSALYGLALQANGRHEEAADYCRAAREGLPGSICTTVIKAEALSLISAGRYEEGFKLLGPELSPPDTLAAEVPPWRGEPLAGRRVVAWGGLGAGLGDALLSCRFLPPLIATGAEVYLSAAPPLVRLFETIPGIAGVVPFPAVPAECDFDVNMRVLPNMLGLERPGDTVANYLPLPAPPPAIVQARAGGPLIGLVWGTGIPSDRHFRSLFLADLLPVLNVPGSRFISLQMDDHARQLAMLPRNVPLLDMRGVVGDFLDTAAVLAGLDLLITADTAAANLAVALGIPFWLLSRKALDMRWREENGRMVWAPNGRLFRQDREGDWTAPVLAIAAELARVVARCAGAPPGA